MPTYGYQCTQCQHEFSVFQAMKDAPLTRCPQCEGSIKRLLYPVGVVFKGSGWYINDSRKPEKDSGGDAPAGDAKSDSAPKSEGGAESKPAATSTAAESKSAGPAGEK
jgi:putative FmdB family regulatory protein